MNLSQRLRHVAVTLAFPASLAPAPPTRSEPLQEIVGYASICDASAGVALDADHFVVADDERNTLRVYRTGERAPVGKKPLHEFLGTDRNEESDLEGAARLGDRIYWISAHGRNTAGEVQKRRYRFFATEIVAGSPPGLETVAEPYSRLLDDLVKDPALEKYKLGCAAELAPEEAGGLNIEGLAATREGHLLIGFRNPVRGGRALLVPLENPAAVVKGKKAEFGTPIDLDLGGRGIRSIERVGETYWILAGPTADEGTFAIYRWAGPSGKPPAQVASVHLEDLAPESIFAWPDGTLQVLSDDGGRRIGGKPCKALDDEARRMFRSLSFTP